MTLKQLIRLIDSSQVDLLTYHKLVTENNLSHELVFKFLYRLDRHRKRTTNVSNT
jgi:hypothetical protein